MRGSKPTNCPNLKFITAFGLQAHDEGGDSIKGLQLQRPITKEATSKTRRTRPWDWLPCDWMRLVTREATFKTRRTQPWDWLKTRRTQPWPSPLVENPPPFTSSTILPSHGALATGQLGTRRAASWQHRPLGPPFHCLPCKVSGLRE